MKVAPELKLKGPAQISQQKEVETDRISGTFYVFEIICVNAKRQD